MTNLDKSKPFGTIQGSAADGARYTQDGKRFHGSGMEIGATPEPAPAPEPVVADVAPEPEPVAEDLAAELKALHPSKIKAIMEKRGLEPATGAGSKAKNIEILLANG